MRLIIALIGFASVITGPWWIPLICMILLCVRWRATEALALGLVMDFAWQGSEILSSTPWWHSFPLFTILGIALLWGFEPLRRQILT